MFSLERERVGRLFGQWVDGVRVRRWKTRRGTDREE
jgi:hypothetical protein